MDNAGFDPKIEEEESGKTLQETSKHLNGHSHPHVRYDLPYSGDEPRHTHHHHKRPSIASNAFSIEKCELDEEETLLYGVEDVPPWYMCIFLGFQHYLEMIGTCVACPFILTPALCMEDDDPNKANIISTLVFMSGLITIIQSTVGTRLPIVQGENFSYLVPTLAIMNLPQWKCPPGSEIAHMSPEDKTELWQVRMREIQGAIIFAALFEVIFAFTRLIGYFTKLITPLTVCPAICLIGLSLFKNVTEQISKNVVVAFVMIALLILFSQHFKHIKVKTFPLFQVFPVLLSLALVWGTCTLLTLAGTLKEGDPARADSKLRIFSGSPWFRVPYPYN